MSDGDGDTGLRRQVELDRDECLALLGSVPVGRVVYTRRALPEIRPVNFLLLPDGVYLRAGFEGVLLRAAECDAVVAFEADDYDAHGRHGWSVTVLGRAGRITDARRLARVAELSQVSYATGPSREVVRISLELVTGRRAGGPVRGKPFVGVEAGGRSVEHSQRPGGPDWPPLGLVPGEARPS